MWQSLLGLLTSAQDLTLRGRLQLRRLQVFLNPYIVLNNPSLLITLPDNLQHSLQWWMTPSNVLGRVSLVPFQMTHHLFVDASREGWGAHLNSQTASGLWSAEESSFHINVLELLGEFNVIRHWRHLLINATLMVATDNVTAAAYISRQGGTHSSSLLDLTYRLFKMTDAIPLHLGARHIPGVSNVLTEWMLNPEAFRWVCQRLWTQFNHQLRLYVSPVPDSNALDLDALAISWDNLDTYAFPPPILLPRVLQRFQEFHCRLLLIAPNWPSRIWYPDLRLAEPDPLPLPDWDCLLLHPTSRQHHPNPSLYQLDAWTLSPRV
ncbi:uncharacterized protein LOC121374484 [Gigantopelta aegis]|uniref:uncharacterized protein LOC121374484 n=1 Tax=Gigantopelta aegis TaxID=1735272 RepID=UPI001B887E0A|nr:uncharacterized protein LOC121374484 [Gigantopelta aegis]